MKNAAKFLSGSVMTYVLMAACSAATGGPKASSTAGGAQAVAGGATGMGGATSQDGSPMAGSSNGGANNSSAGAAHSGAAGMLGMMMDPVPDAAAEPATDGSRLKAEYNVGADGSRQFAGWWDSQRNEECAFQPFADGSQHCVPLYTGVIQLGFSDSSCSSALFAIALSTCPDPATVKYALSGAAWGCTAFSYAAVESLTLATPDKIFSGTPAACVDVTASYKPVYNFFTGTEIPLSSFVAATKQHA
jgi:hypothetical protein